MECDTCKTRGRRLFAYLGANECGECQDEREFREAIEKHEREASAFMAQQYRASRDSQRRVC